MVQRTFLLVLAALVMLCFAQAEDSIDGMSLDALYALRERVDARISELEQASDPSYYDSGTYCVGTDLPAGDYMLLEYEDAVFASIIVRTEAAEDSGLLAHHLVNGQSVIHLEAGTWVTFSEARAYPLKKAPRAGEGPWGEGGYLVGEMLPAGEYLLTPTDLAPLSSYSVYDGILGTNAQLTRFEVLRGETTIELHEGEYIELSGCGLKTITTSTEGTEP